MAYRLPHTQPGFVALCAMLLPALLLGCGDTSDGGGPGGASPVTSTFDSDDGGWTMVALPSQQ
ncbi:MAG: hypothetical protein ACOCXM_06030 [Myxococcota bacterium]